MSPARNRQKEAKKEQEADKAAAGPTPGPPRPGSVYHAHRDILIGGDAHEAKRRIAAIKSPPGPPDLWITLGRTTTDNRPGDLESPMQPDCSFDKKGWFSMRFKHTICTSNLGNEARCPYKGELSEDSRIKVLSYYDDCS